MGEPHANYMPDKFEYATRTGDNMVESTLSLLLFEHNARRKKRHRHPPQHTPANWRLDQQLVPWRSINGQGMMFVLYDII